MFLLVGLLLLFTLLFWKLKSSRQYWSKKGVLQHNNGFILGDTWSLVLRKQSFPEMIQEAYKICPNTRYSGFYHFLLPVLLVKDPELIKQITVKDFNHFVNHKSFIPEDGDPLFSKNIFTLKNQKWRDMRATMSPVFTSSKMKFTFSLICENGKQFVDHFLKKNEDIITVELTDIFTRFATDVVANFAFGVEINSLENPDNEFYVRGKSLADFSGIVKMIKLFGFYVCPSLYKIFKISPFSKIDGNFFSDVVLNSIRSREKYNISRPDLITILLQAKRSGFEDEDHPSDRDTGFATIEESEINKKFKSKIKISDEDIIAQAVGFFFAGFETVSGIMCFMSYELGVNPDVQKKLIEEVDKTSDACDGDITYEALFGMKYMDMVVSESLRKWPRAVATDRLCTNPYTIEPKKANETRVYLETDSYIWIPVFALHRDPKYFPEPEKFDPERFNDDNKEKIVPYTYLPFGVGPRGCIGSRLALMEIKILFFYLLSHYEIVPVEKTQIPLKIGKSQINYTAEDGFWFGLKRRVK